MRFIVAVVFLLSLFSLCPADTPSSGPLSIPDEASWLSYYYFRSSHPLLSRDSLNGVLSEGHRLQFEAASSAFASKIADSPEDGFLSLYSMINAVAKDGLDARSVFAPTFSALRSILLEGKPEIAKNLESISERLDATPSLSVDSRSGYLAWLAARCGNENETPDAEYLKAFPDAPWDKGLLKFWGDLHYFGRRFDKAIEIYRRAITKGDEAATTVDRYSPFFEAEIRQRIGQCHLIQGRADSAAVELSRAAALTGNPERATSRLFEAVSLCRLKRHDEALTVIETVKSSTEHLPNSLVRSLAVQEAAARYGKGEWSKVLDLLKPLAALKDTVYLLPPDRKLVHLLMAGSYRETGDDAKADEMLAAAAQDPPASEVERLDPMVADYEDSIKADEAGPSQVAFKFDVSTSSPEKDELRVATLVCASEKVSVYAYNKFGSSIGDFTVGISGTGGSWSIGQGAIDSSNRFFIPLQSDPLDRSGEIVYDVTAFKPGFPETASGKIYMDRITYHLGIFYLNPEQSYISYYLHFSDANKNGILDEGESITDPTTTPLERDKFETSLPSGPTWSSGEMANYPKHAYPLVLVKGALVKGSGELIPSSKPGAKYRKRKITAKLIVVSSLGNEVVEVDIPTISSGSSVGNSLFKNFMFNNLSVRPGKRDASLRWKMSVEGIESSIPVGVSEHEFLVSNGVPINESWNYVSVYRFSSILYDEYVAKSGSFDEFGFIKHAVANLHRLTNDEVDSPTLRYTTEFESLGEYPYYQAYFHLGKLLDLRRGNAAAWVSALKQILAFQGISSKKINFSAFQYDAHNVRFLTDWTGIGQEPLKESEVKVVFSGFPGVPSAENGDIKTISKVWQSLRTLAFLAYNDGTTTWTIDPVFRHDPGTTYMRGVYDGSASSGVIGNYKPLLENYVSKASTHLFLPRAACFDAYGKSVFWDLAIPLELMIKRPLYVSWTDTSKSDPDPAEIRRAHEAVMQMCKTGEARTNHESSRTPNGVSSGKNDSAEETELLDIANTFGNISNPSGPGGGSYTDILNRLDSFIATYPQTKYRAFWLYMYDRALLLGVAKKSFEKWFHVPGWWYGDNAYQENKKEILNPENEKRIEKFFWSSWDTVQMDGFADGAFLLGNYYQMAGGTEGLHTSEILLDYTAHPSWNPPGGYTEYKPWALALLGETHSRQADIDPAVREKAVKIKEEFLSVAAGQFTKDNPEVVARSLYTLGADQLFAGSFEKAAEQFERLSRDFPKSIYAAGADIMLAYARFKKSYSNYLEAEHLLREVYENDYSTSQMNSGYHPWAAMVLAKLYSDVCAYKNVITIADKLLATNILDELPADYGPFYNMWLKTHQAGVLVHKAMAQTMLGDHDKALATLDQFESDYKDDQVDQLSKVGIPYPPLVYPVWGDDTGDWSTLFKRFQRGERINRTLKTRTAEYEKIKVRFVNPYRDAAKFTKAIVNINHGNLAAAETLLTELMNRQPSNKFLTVPVVGADPFLISVSPQTTNEYKQFAKEMIEGKRLAGFKIFVDNEHNEYKNNNKLYINKNSSHKIIIKAVDMKGNILSTENYKLKFPVIFEFAGEDKNIIDNKEKNKILNKSIESYLPSDSVGCIRGDIYIESNDGKLCFYKQINFYVIQLMLSKVSFDVDSAHTIKKDDGSIDYTAPHWQDNSNPPDGDADDSGDRKYPICYTRKTKMKVTAEFYIQPIIPGILINVKGEGIGNLNFPDTPATVNDHLVTLINVECSNNFADSVGFYDSMIINWKYSCDGGRTWDEAGACTNQTYITLGVPNATIYHTLIHIGCVRANEETNQGVIVDKIWEEFEHAPTPIITIDDKISLIYYKTPFDQLHCSYNVEGLLANGDGRCGAWARFFRDIIKIQGIKGAVLKQINLITKEGWNSHAIWVKNQNLSPVIDNYNPFKPLPLPGITGQGSEDPSVSIFDDHAVVTYNEIIYDPSYGKKYQYLIEWQRRSLDAVSYSIGLDLEKLYFYLNTSDEWELHVKYTKKEN